MFNEVWKKCPKCRERAMAQIAQVVDGFGNFDLDETESIVQELTLAQLRQLEEKILHDSTWFECRCGHRFRLLDDAEREDRLVIARRLARSVERGDDA